MAYEVTDTWGCVWSINPATGEQRMVSSPSEEAKQESLAASRAMVAERMAAMRRFDEELMYPHAGVALTRFD